MIGVEMGALIKLSSNSLGVSSSLLPPVCNALNFHRQAFLGGNKRRAVSISEVWFTSSLCPVTFTSRQRTASLEVHATVTQTEQPKWWERNGGPNMIDIHSTQEFLNALSEAGERLVVVEFYGTWCASCRALFPKLCRTAKDHGDILFLKVDFDENKPMCRSLNVKMLPHFHFYRGADGQLEAFSCSLAKFQKIKEAIELHNTARCSIGPPRGVGDLILDTSPQLQESTGA